MYTHSSEYTILAFKDVYFSKIRKHIKCYNIIYYCSGMQAALIHTLMSMQHYFTKLIPKIYYTILQKGYLQ